MKLNIDPKKCLNCGLCESVCIFGNISLEDEVHEVGVESCFECGHCVAICPTGAVNLKKYDNYDTSQKYETTKIPVKTDDYLKLLDTHRSTRWFTNRQVDEEVFDKLFKAVANTPTADNRQDIEFVVITGKLDEFMEHAYSILKQVESTTPRIRQYRQYLDDPAGKKNPLLWDGKQLILGFSTNVIDTAIAASRIELMAQTMGLGGFYSKFIMMTDKLDHDRLMEFFPHIDPSKHMHTAYIIGYPKKRFKRQLPEREYKITYN